jgi:hypothetical protein
LNLMEIRLHLTIYLVNKQDIFVKVTFFVAFHGTFQIE